MMTDKKIVAHEGLGVIAIDMKTKTVTVAAGPKEHGCTIVYIHETDDEIHVSLSPEFETEFVAPISDEDEAMYKRGWNEADNVEYNMPPGVSLTQR